VSLGLVRFLAALQVGGKAPGFSTIFFLLLLSGAPAAGVLLSGGRFLSPCQARQACHIEPKIAQEGGFGT